jgi:hypothetical protein
LWFRIKGSSSTFFDYGEGQLAVHGSWVKVRDSERLWVMEQRGFSFEGLEEISLMYDG